MHTKLRKRLGKFVNYLTLGIDSYRKDRKYQIQLVCLIDMKNNKYYWTGKSYPVKNKDFNEENDLIRMPLETHFINSIMVLGCHDLYLLINRGKKTDRKTERKIIRKKFQKMTKEKKPTYILHHPHYTDSVRIWSSAWGASNKLKTVKNYASGINFSRNPRSKLNDVLNKTKKGNTIDFIFNIKDNFGKISQDS